ncbi:bifunctional DNA-formamidopyrimidine glycosylase/DNA-(apurinic or apyrimidinic site) lyase [Halorhodospira halophila]|uniref:Formamidopyrimidine-DNA glycosylase n=1 Tax=Halorhodospira halophila (strain DSM 244 / SL1) TaxID=349124 RepID=FPG_HALHL|nr:bifunctional DNA-formamidopyrimidine glycosylase/DNA-(apurinic or apyrimidinic site) lyase [Halorhodospira halophila]A1WZG2.1 RecName: Full=Formamidopyrimidine-DNA glycosylase; Short=Fapy-DNA glycosylase; AltName: Full=DNA-(apurinic or apyrimidinic site) lyase MutM; Short=AP lyase MutM [Halorhodospira halophila SL1]ABM63074.1 DNA-(apurinic or apyrimidinic site) lyase / Formamidopyrimidine-DNA glycosylase [Halorhodospira halophila SL1]MBK1727804.1 formamidopyrimidine-DNA glycosylase [Halorhodo
MPELPEVETTRRGLQVHLVGRTLQRVVVRQRQLRYPVPARVEAAVVGEEVVALERRAKYLLIRLGGGAWLLLHLGMSGSLRLVAETDAPGRHDHVDLVLNDGRAVRLTDPRRFGCLLLGDGDPQDHRLLRRLGPEPLGSAFDGAVLHRAARGRRVAVKALLMDATVVVGVGNIYANEALFRAGIRPDRAAGRIARARYDRLAGAVRAVLEAALAAGGTTLRDFTDGSGEPGYFAVNLSVYGASVCPVCGGALRQIRLAQRGTWFCPRCQR